MLYRLKRLLRALLIHYPLDLLTKELVQVKTIIQLVIEEIRASFNERLALL